MAAFRYIIFFLVLLICNAGYGQQPLASTRIAAYHTHNNAPLRVDDISGICAVSAIAAQQSGPDFRHLPGTSACITGMKATRKATPLICCAETFGNNQLFYNHPAHHFW